MVGGYAWEGCRRVQHGLLVTVFTAVLRGSSEWRLWCVGVVGWPVASTADRLVICMAQYGIGSGLPNPIPAVLSE